MSTSGSGVGFIDGVLSGVLLIFVVDESFSFSPSSPGLTRSELFFVVDATEVAMDGISFLVIWLFSSFLSNEEVDADNAEFNELEPCPK